MTQPFKRDVRVHGKGPVLIHTETSVAMMVSDAILDRIQAIPAFASFNFASTVAYQVQPDDIPFCGVYLMREVMTPDGDSNAGEVRFRTTAVIGISVIIQNNDPETADRKLDALYQRITTLFTDRTLYDNPIFKIQAFLGGSRTHVFGNMAKDNETPMAELRLELNLDLGTITYEPQITDDLEIIHLQTKYPPPPKDSSGVQQIVSVYDLEQGE